MDTISTLDSEIKTVYCLYRVSTKGQVDKNDIPMQKQACREFAARQRGWLIKKEFQEKGVSGFKVSANDRDAVQKLKTAALKKEFDILLVFMFDRLGRIDNETPFVVEWFINNGIEVWSVNEGEQRMTSHVDKLTNYIRFWQANGESVKTSLRVKTRLQQLVEEGSYTGGCAPFGYKLVNSGVVNKKGKEVLKLEIEPSEVPIVKLIFEKSVKDGLGSYKMAEYINDRKITTHNGAKFQSNTIKRILSNEIYCGFYVRGGVKSRRIEELQIIDDETFVRAQEILAQRKHNQEKRTQISQKAKSSTLLGGNLYCAHCGQKMYANSFVDRYMTKDGKLHNSGRRYRYLCSGASMKRNDCDGQTVYTAQKVDDAVIRVLHECFRKIKTTPKDAAIEKRFQAHISELKLELKRLEKESENLKRKLRELTAEIANALLGESKFTEEALALAIGTVKDKLEENTKLIEDNKKLLQDNEAEMSKLDYYYEQFVSWADEFDNATPERKRMIICTLFREITIAKGYKIEILMDGSYEQFIS